MTTTAAPGNYTKPPATVTVRKQAARIHELVRTLEAERLDHAKETRQLREALAHTLDQLKEEQHANRRLTLVIRHLRSTDTRRNA